MRTIKPSNLDPYDFYCDVVKNKRNRNKDKTYKPRITGLLATSKVHIEAYTNAFNNTNIESIRPIVHKKQEADDFKSLYAYGVSDFIMLRKNIEEQNGGHEIAVCPLCENDRVKSLDHFLPQANFPELSAHPLNLMPCCYACNQNKLNIWHKTGMRECFNIYIDKEPLEQYLFCDISLKDDIPYGSFRIDGALVADKVLFRTIENTFNNLKLIDSYNKTSNNHDKSILVELIKQMKLIKSVSPLSHLECANRMLQELYLEPINDYKAVFKIALLESDISLCYINNEIDNLLGIKII